MVTNRRGSQRKVAKIATVAVATGLALCGTGLVATPDAHADGYLTGYEKIAGADSWYATCTVFDDMFTGHVHTDTAVALGVTQGVSDEYALSLDNSVDVVNYQVSTYCPRHWDNLVAIGGSARNGSGTDLA